MESKHWENLCRRTHALHPDSNCNVKCRQRKMTDLQPFSHQCILQLRKFISFSKHITYFVTYFHCKTEISCHLTKGQDLGIKKCLQRSCYLILQECKYHYKQNALHNMAIMRKWEPLITKIGGHAGVLELSFIKICIHTIEKDKFSKWIK